MYNENSDGLATGYMIGADRTAGYNNAFGGDWAWIIILALLFGWGRNGFGGGFGGGNDSFIGGYDIGKLATTNDVASGFNNSAVLSSLNDLKLGQAGLQQTLCQGFNGINTSVLTSTNALQSQISNCCCQLERQLADDTCSINRNIDSVNYNMATNTASIIQASNNNTQRILDYLCQEKISSLQAENAALTSQLSQFNQTTNIINALRPTPVPSFPASQLYGFYGNNCGCGC